VLTAVSLEHAAVPADTGEVTLLIARRVEPGHEAAFEQWAKGLLESAATFPGRGGVPGLAGVA
jgi:antibiotic biosynthesis monooxygenase (ABM) superfamily enzyme